MNKIAIVLPMYNEAENIKPLMISLEKILKKKKISFEVVAINDGSCDQTLSILQKISAKKSFLKIINHRINRGFAQALKTGIDYCLKHHYQKIIFMDADQTHNPKDIPQFLSKLSEGNDLVIGSRYIKGGGMKNVPWGRVVISMMGNHVFRQSLNLSIRDITSGYRAVKADVFKNIKLESTDFRIQPEMTVKIFANSFRISEVPVILFNRQKGKSKFNYNLKTFLDYLIFFIKCHQWIKNARKKNL